MKWEVFSNAPITEALLDIQVELAPNIDLKVLLSCHNDIIDEYPNKENRIQWTSGIELELGKDPVFTTNGGHDGYIFTSIDEKLMVQTRLNGFTYNMLKPYTHWEDFVSKAKNHWNQYVEVAKPLKITRIGLRYVNRLEIPLPLKDFKEYILTVPDIAPNIPPGLSDFFMRLVVPNPQATSTAIITETIDTQSLTDQIMPLILDIDVFQNLSETVINNDIWNLFEEMHEFKNVIFFNSITDKGKELFRK